MQNAELQEVHLLAAAQNNLVPGSGYGNVYVDSIVWGCGWQGGPVTYWFGAGACTPHTTDMMPFTGDAWTQAEKDAFTRALGNYSAVCGLTFHEAASEGAANIVWWLADNAAFGGPGLLGMHEVPDQSTAQLYGYFNAQHATWNYLATGGDGYVTIIHELGHGMGLAHPHDGGDHSDATIFPGVRDAFSTGKGALNQGIWTTMSYNDGWTSAPATSYAYGYQGSLMAFDIAALQAIYGANNSTATGDDSYQLPAVQGVGTGWTCIWDAGGTDTITNAGSSLACTINLNAAPLTGTNAGGFVSRVTGITGGFTLANHVTIENATGGSGNDTHTGNAGANVLDGGAGADKMLGGAGDDTYMVDNALDVITELSGAGIDTMVSSVARTLASNVENLVLTGSASIAGTGNGLANSMLGNSGNNILNAGTGNDTLQGGAGADTLTGGKGIDKFVYTSLTDSTVGARDVITDFKVSQFDVLDLSAIDADTASGGDQAFTYIGAAAFGSHAGELNLVAGVLAGDVDGDGVADFAVQLFGVTSLTGASIIL
jgi:serralysin